MMLSCDAVPCPYGNPALPCENYHVMLCSPKILTWCHFLCCRPPPQEGLVPQPPPDGDETETETAPLDPGAVDGETLERLAQTEQLVVQLKELIREKDNQLAKAERQLKVREQLDG